MANIVSATYQVNNASVRVVLDNGRVASVPMASTGAWSVRLQEWVDDGNTIAPYVPPTPPTAAELADQFAQTKADLYGVIGFLLKDNFHLQNRVAALDGGTVYPVTLAGAQSYIDDTQALTGLPDAKLKKFIELFV